MNSIHRMSRLIVAAMFMAGSPGSALAASALAPVLAPNGAVRGLPGRGQPADQAAQARAASGFGKLGVYFEKNHGQTDPSVKFFARTAGYNLYLTGTEAVMVMPRAKGSKATTAVVVRMKLKGANVNPPVRGLDLLPGRTSYFIGNDPAKWQTGVEQFAKVGFSKVYPGIDMVYYGAKGHVEHDFVVAPGANPGRILVGFEGAKSLRLDAKGDLIIGVEGGQLTYQAPKLYQMRGDKRVSVKGRFALSGKNVRFVVGDYLKKYTLVIDPQLVYSTYLGGNLEDEVLAIAVDKSNQAYLTGYSISDATGVSGFPAPTAAFGGAASNAKKHAFVAKLSADGASLMWLAWLGGALDDQANSIALDNSSVSTPNVFITGTTKSPTFPVAGPAMQGCGTIAAPGSLAFVAQLGQPGNIPAPVYSTCWGDISGGGVVSTVANGIAVDTNGAAYVTGTTFGASFPIVGGALAPFNVKGGASEAGYAMKIPLNGTGGVAYSMYLGTSDTITRSNAIAVDKTFHAWVAGMTTATTLPGTGTHFAPTDVGTSDAFVAEVNTTGTGLDYSTYINGNSDQEATAIALNNGGATPYNVFVAGWTVSATGFPSTAYLLLPTSGPGSRPLVYQKTLQGADDPFIFRLNPAAASAIQEMVFATHLAATGADRAYALALDDADDSYIAGWTVSSDWTLAADPVTPGANGINVTGATTSNTTSGGRDAFVAAINGTGQFQPFFSYLGATPGGQEARGIAIDANRNIYVAGFTPSAIFPLVTGSLEDGSVAAKGINRTAIAGTFDGFVTKIAPVLSFNGAPPAFCTLNPNPNNGFALGGGIVTITGTGFTGLVGSSAVTFDGIDAASYSVNSPTVITAVLPRHPLAGPVVFGPVNLVVTNGSGSCTTGFTFVNSPFNGTNCGPDFFYPSPATGPQGNFAYCMDLPGTAKVRVYNSIGDLVSTVEDPKPAGPQISQLNTARLSPGVYLYILEKNYSGGKSVHSRVQKFVVKH